MNQIFIATLFFLCTSPLWAMNNLDEQVDITTLTKFLIKEPVDEIEKLETLLKSFIVSSNNNLDDYIYIKDFKKYSPLGLAHSYKNWIATYVLLETGADPNTLNGITAQNHIGAYYETRLTAEQLIEQALYAKNTIKKQKQFFNAINIVNKKINAFSSKPHTENSELQSHFEKKLDIYIMTLISALGNSLLQYEKPLQSYYARMQCNNDFICDIESLLNLELIDGKYQTKKNPISLQKNYENFKTALKETMPETMRWKITQKYQDDF